MSVERIIGGKGREVVTIEPSRTLREAAATLNRHRIGAVVVVDEDGGVVGIVSERDFVKAVAGSGDGALDEPVSKAMTIDVATCTPATSIDELMVLMTERKFRHVPVIDGGSLGGIVSIGDVVKHRLAAIEAEHQAMKDYIATA